MSADGIKRSPRLANLIVVAAWVALAVAANIVLALMPAKTRDTGSTLLPRDAQIVAANNRLAQAFPGTGTDAIAYLVLDGRDPLGPGDQKYYDAAVSALRADTAHVGSVLDWWSDPLTAPLGTSPDSRSAIAVVWLRGEAGTPKAAESLDAARALVRKLPSAGLRARVTAPATTSGAALPMAAWQAAAIVAAAALIAVLLLLRAGQSGKSVGIVLLAAGLSLAVAWPLAAVFGLALFSVTLGAVLTIGVIAAAALLAARVDRRSYRDLLPSLALPGGCVAILIGPLLFARLPAVHSVGLSALGVVVALGASLTLLPALIGVAGSADQPGVRGPTLKSPLSLPRPALAVALVLAICAVPVLGASWSVGDAGPARAGGTRFVPSSRLPDVVLVKSTHDLRDPAGLIAVDAVSRRIMEVPGVRKVQSAAWPAGVPWADASLSSAAGRLSDQLDRQAATFVPQVTAIKTLASVLDQVSGSVNELEASVTAGVGGLAQMQRAIDMVVSGTRNIKDTAAQVSGYLDPVRGWMGNIQDCTADVLCATARKAVDPFDRVIADVTVLSDGADRIAGGSSRAINALTSTPRAVAQMRSALTQLRSFVPTLQTTIESTIPQVVQLSAFLKNISADFADTGAGGFYLPRKALADPSYQHVRQTMFTPDGTATRLLVYSDETRLDLDAAARAQQLEIAVTSATKYGSLLDSEMTVSGGAPLAAAVRAALIHDAILLAVTLLAVAVLVGMWRGVGSGLTVGIGIPACWLAGLGVTVALWQHLSHRVPDASAAPVSFAILAACGIPYLVAALFADGSLRRALAPLAGAGAVFGAGLVVVLGASLGAVVVLGLGALVVVAHLLDGDRLIPLGQRDLDRP